MAIAFDAASSGVVANTSVTVAHTCTGSDRALYVWAYSFRSSGTPGAISCTYNGGAMTEIAAILRSAINNTRLVAFGVIAPATGGANIIASSALAVEIGIVAVSYTGVDQTTAWEGAQTHDQEADPPNLTTTVSSAVGDLVLGGIDWFNGTETLGGGQTERVNVDGGSSTQSMAAAEESGAASVTFTYDITGTSSARMIAFNVNAAGGAATAVKDIIGGGLIPWAR